MFREIRRKDRAADKADIERLLVGGEYGILATVGPEGYPYAVPLNYAYVNRAVYFHCAPTGHKLDNIASEIRVSFCIVGNTRVLPDKFSTEYESVILFGHASPVDGEEKRTALEALICKYAGDFKEEGMAYINRAADKTAVIKIEIEQVTGKIRRGESNAS